MELLGDMLQEEGLAQCTRNKQKPFAAIAQVLLTYSYFAELASILHDASTLVSKAETWVMNSSGAKGKVMAMCWVEKIELQPCRATVISCRIHCAGLEDASSQAFTVPTVLCCIRDWRSQRYVTLC